MAKYDGVDWTDRATWHCNDNVHPSRHGTYDGISMHPYEVRAGSAAQCSVACVQRGRCLRERCDGGGAVLGCASAARAADHASPHRTASA